MDKTYNQTKVEQKWYKVWEENGYFKPEINPRGSPYTIILPPPNANANLHFGHAMYTIEDILIRYHRMKGEAALWLPGADHAGFETQVVFERHLQTQGKSRFDFDRDTLYQMIWDFVQENTGNMEGQLKRLGFSLDWSRFKFTLDLDIIRVVYSTFKRLYDDGLVYKAERLVNYCTTNGTSFSDLEVKYVERDDKLYFIKYPLVEGSGEIVVATTRPETIFGDVAVAVNPKDKKYTQLIGQEVKLPLTQRVIPIIEDDLVVMDFGTGAVKVTPAHDPTDFEIGRKHQFKPIGVINFDGTLNEQAGKYTGSDVAEARRAVVEDLQNQGLIKKVENYKHRVGLCYKCNTTIEPLLMTQWFIKIKPLADQAIKAVKDGQIKINPGSFDKTYFNWLENIKDWNISRQIVWGIQIPAFYCIKCDQITVTEGEKPPKCSCGSSEFTQEDDTFDTWFSSGQWPYATLKTTQEGDFDKFYPTSVMETGYDILFFWVARMVMLGLYATNKTPFEEVILHGLVLDPLGKKMSKSKGNVVSPIQIVDEYGADAARMALIFGTALGHDQILSYPKLQAMRNFTNKLWNIGRFLIEFKPEGPAQEISQHKDDREILKQLDGVSQKVTQALDNYRFNDASETLYEFVWHEFADKYIEKTKQRRAEAQPCLEYVFKTCLELLHPFMPFITEELWQRLPHTGESIMLADWPTVTS
ncbi:valine--tRNA ligase [Candidatus Daviesbacteria bacterium]|nr:valine--tRNA ligase [Candidatus Daviesbacteria bacterium]